MLMDDHERCPIVHKSMIRHEICLNIALIDCDIHSMNGIGSQTENERIMKIEQNE